MEHAEGWEEGLTLICRRARRGRRMPCIRVRASASSPLMLMDVALLGESPPPGQAQLDVLVLTRTVAFSGLLRCRHGVCNHQSPSPLLRHTTTIFEVASQPVVSSGPSSLSPARARRTATAAPPRNCRLPSRRWRHRFLPNEGRRLDLI